MNTARSRTLLLATLILWVLGYALWVTNYVLDPPPFALDHALRGLAVFTFGAMLCLAVGRMLHGMHDLCARAAHLTAVAVVAVTTTTVLLALFNELVMHVIVPRWGGPTWKSILEQMPVMFWLFGTWALLYFALAADNARRDREVQLVQATAAALDAQHRLLVQQINPHFLFNALNTVYGLVLEGDDARARRCLLALSAFLRSSIDRKTPRVVPLSGELAAVRHFLDIELIRYGERLHLIESVSSDLLDRSVPALILQPLVENCIKHGLHNNAGSMTIWLSATLGQNELVLSVEDDGRSSPGADVQATGVGLNNVSERLRLLYGGIARLITHVRPEGGFVAQVHLPAP